MKNERWLSKKLRERMPEHNLHCYTFEDCGRNVPDLYVVGQRPAFWLELKVVDSCDCLIPFRKGQPQWIDEHREHGGQTFIVVIDNRQDELRVLQDSNTRRLAALKLGLAGGFLLGKINLDHANLWGLLSELFYGHPGHKEQHHSKLGFGR